MGVLYIFSLNLYVFEIHVVYFYFSKHEKRSLLFFTVKLILPQIRVKPCGKMM